MLLCAGGSFLACVPSYNSQPVQFGDGDVRTTLSTRYDYSSTDHSISDNWRRVNAVCDLVEARMQRELDGIDMRNNLIGAGFAAVAAALATSSGLYSLWKGSDADSRVTATLGLGAGASTIPTFFYLGADRRETLLKLRMQAIDDGRALVLKAFSRLEEADRTWDAGQRKNPQDPDELARARAERQKADDALNESLLTLAERCR